MTRYSFAVILCIIAMPGILFAVEPLENKAVKITGTYSTLRFHPEADDLVGEEMRIAYTNHGYQGTLQIAEGAPSEVFLFSIEVNDSAMSFKIKDNNIYSGYFKGKIGADCVTGTLNLDDGGKIELKLPRRKSYWD